MKDNLKTRVIEVSKKHGLSHVGSCLSVLPILEEIYANKKPGDKVILDNAHAHLAHLVVQEAHKDAMGFDPVDAELITKDIHCNREAGCDALGGSLGHGIGIAIGYALAMKTQPHKATKLTDRLGRSTLIHHLPTVWCVTSDGALQEGSDWEALRLIRLLKIPNIKVIVNMNGYTAVAQIDQIELSDRLQVFYPDIDIRYTTNGLPELEGVKGHYEVLK